MTGGIARRTARMAIAAAALLAGIVAGQAEAMPTASLRCDERSARWDQSIAACPADGTAYPRTSDGWRDGVTVDLAGFSCADSSTGFPLAALEAHWFGEEGGVFRYRKGQAIVLDNLRYPSRYAAVDSQPCGGFLGRLTTLPASRISPGRYRILFRARIPCPSAGFCDKSSTLPEGFAADPGDAPRISSGFSRYEFAWAEIRILDGARPGIDPRSFALICQPLGSACAAGSPFFLETRGPVRQLGHGGCLKFYDGRGSVPVQAPLRDEKGAPVFGPRDYRLSGFGNMPGAGTWKAFLECTGDPPVPLGEYALKEGPKAPPTPPPAVPVTKFELSPKIGRKTLPRDYNAPYPAFGSSEIYPGMELQIAVPPPAGWNLYAHGRPQRYDILLDGGKLTWDSPFDWDTAAMVPPTISPGTHRITIRAEHYVQPPGKIEFEGSLDVTVAGTPPHPRMAVSGRPETDLEIQALIAPVYQAMEVESVAVMDHDGAPDPVRSRSTVGASGIALAFTVPLEKVWVNGPGRDQLSNARDARVRVGFRQRLADGTWHSFSEIYPLPITPVCRGASNPRIEAAPAAVIVRPGSAITLKVSGFPCGDRVAVFSESDSGARIDWGIAGRLGPGGDGLESGIAGSVPIEVRGLEGRLSPRAQERLTFVVRGETGVEARQAVTIIPVVFIEANPRKAKQGQRIAVTPHGFRTGIYAHLFLGDARLTPEQGRPLEDGQALDVRLPEGLSGPQTIRLVDNAGNQAEDRIEIEGDGADAVCTTPCVKLPQRARQGEPFDAILGGFPRNEQLVVRFADLFEVAKPYQRDAMMRQPVAIPTDVRDGRYRVQAVSLNDPSRAAQGEIDVAGGYRRPTLAIACPKNQPGCLVPRFASGESVNTSGFGWTVKGRIAAALIPETGPSRPIGVSRDGCVWGFVDGNATGKPCDGAKGEINRFWELPRDIAAGAWVIEVTDGIDASRAQFLVGAAATGGMKQPTPPAQPPAVEPPPAQPKVCDPDLPKLWHPGCVAPTGGTEGSDPRPGVSPGKAPICDPSRPRYAQPGCVEAGTGANPAHGPATPGKCNPGIPKYAQPGCIP